MSKIKRIIEIEDSLYNRIKVQMTILEDIPCLCDAVVESKPYEARPQGEWVYGEDECGQDGWFCSECGFFVPWYYEFYADIDFIRDYKVCPHCISNMITYTGKDRGNKP